MTDAMGAAPRRAGPACIAVGLLLIAALGIRCDAKDGDTVTPVFIYDDGWFAEQGYRCWDAEARWRAVPEDLRPHAWLTLYVAPEWIYHLRNSWTHRVPPEPDPEYARKYAALVSALEYCQRQGIGTVLMVRRHAKLREAAPTFATVEALLKRYGCIRALLLAELGGSRFTDIDQEHLRGFTDLAKRYGRKIIWAVYLHYGATRWNQLMADREWLSFLCDNADVIVPTWKTVEPVENMLNWADCMGLWLSGASGAWGFQFDGWYWASHHRRSRNGERKFWKTVYQGDSLTQASGHSCGPAIMSTPPYLVKDTMILAALSGAEYFTTERLVAFCPFDGGGSLRSVLEKTQRLILTRGLCRGRERVVSQVKVVAMNPAENRELENAGYLHSRSPALPNRLWSVVFGIQDKGLDIVPNEGRFFVVPVVPAYFPRYRAGWQPRVLAPAEVADGSFRKVLEEAYPRRFTADDPNVLIFDAGEIVYVTDSREDGRTTLDFTLESSIGDDCRCTYLAQDATPVDAEPVTEKLPGGWRKRFILFAGCSVILETIRQ